jgi:hypothetical protein
LNQPLVGAGDLERVLLVAGDLHRDALWHRILDVVAEPELQAQHLALERGAKPRTLDGEVAGEALGNADDRIGQQRARRAPGRTGPLALRPRGEHDAARVELGLDVLVDAQDLGAELALDRELLARDLDVDPLRHRDGLATDTRHDSSSLRRPVRRPGR